MIVEQKEALRKSMRAELKNLSSIEKESASALIVAKVAGVIKSTSKQPKVVASFSALSFEPDLAGLRSVLPEADLVYPLCVADQQLKFYSVDEPSRQLRKGHYGISEPDPERCEEVMVDDIDLFLVPAFAYTKHGHRLGKGGGYYDRVLTKTKAKSLGVIFKCQLLESVPIEDHDEIIDEVIAL